MVYILNNFICADCSLNGIGLCNWSQVLGKFEEKILVDITINSCPKFDPVAEVALIDEDTED